MLREGADGDAVRCNSARARGLCSGIAGFVAFRPSLEVAVASFAVDEATRAHDGGFSVLCAAVGHLAVTRAADAPSGAGAAAPSASVLVPLPVAAHFGAGLGDGAPVTLDEGWMHRYV